MERLERKTKPTEELAVRQKHKRNKSDESKPRWVWSDLPDDIVTHIIGKLCWSDRIRMCAVCKSLQSLVHGIQSQTTDIFPWVMSYTWRKTDHGRVYGICRLADPSAQKSYVIEDEVKEEERRDFVHAVPCASRNGWVLFRGYCNTFFFYSPFTNEVIKLPEVDLNNTPNLKATFSSNPTSTDCVVLILFNKYISTWSPGDKTWTHLNLYGLCGVYQPPLVVTYASEIFYCVFVNGRLGSYNTKLKEWKMFANVFPVQLKGAATAYLIDQPNEDKDLLLMCSFSGRWELWRFDMSRECWVKEQRIGNRAIFLGCTSYSVPAVGRSSEFADKIYCLEEICHTKAPMCASLEDRKIWLQTELYSWMPRISAEKLIWIQPPI